MDVRRLYREQLEEEERRQEHGNTDPSSCDVGDLVDLAFKELEVARRKAEATLSTARQQASRIYREARRDARGLLVKARERATRLEEAGEVRAKAAVSAAQSEGLSQGYEEGHRQGLAQCHDMVASVREILQALQLERERCASCARDGFAQVVMAALRRIVDIHRRLDEELLIRVLDRVSRECFPEETALEIRLNPLDLELIESLGEAPGDSHYLADASLARGECRVVGSSFACAVSIDDRLDAIEAELRAALDMEYSDGS